MVSDYLISIVIPCYNDAKYIEQAVQSALNQTYFNIEVIVVDDGSDKLTKEVLKKLEPIITILINQENLGQSVARNVGIRKARGEYILTLDSDDYFEPTFCEKAIALFLKSKEIKLVSCQANLLFEDGSSYVFVPNGGSVSDFLYASHALGTSMFRKTDWNDCGGYDESMRQGLEDWEFFIRLLKNEGLAVIIQEPLYNYRKRQGSTTSIANKNKYNILNYIYKKHKELYIHNYDNFIVFLINKMECLDIENNKIYQKIDFRLGNILLKPVRMIKSLMK
jgi:glycosyltransferase involved in cell wall biosynthesis